MGLHLKIMDCQGKCRSCYERRIRKTQGKVAYNLDAMLATLRREADKETPENRRKYSAPCVHGGEPLLFPPADLRTILKTMFDLYGRTSIQTNGVLMTDEHIAMFKEFKTSVGVSIDGDTAVLNQGRWNDGNLSPGRMEELTHLTLENMARAQATGLCVSAIVVLRRYNAAPEQLPELERFLLRLEGMGITSIRTNEVIVYEDEFRDEELTPEELGRAFVYLADLCFANPVRQWYPYRDIVKMLTEGGDATCTFNACDIWRTGAERAIKEDGAIGVCLKGGAALDGIQALAADTTGTERVRALPSIPQDQGGCKDCEFWGLCSGGCPGSAIDNDWRNRTRFCAAYKMLFRHVRARIQGLMPGMKLADPTQRARIWAGDGQGCVREDDHGDSHGNSHGDEPHGDHTDV